MQSSDPPSPLIGLAPRMVRLRDQIARVASTDFAVLIEGESGSGKELVARQVHEQGARRDGPFIAINCAAIVDTLVEAELFGIEDRTATGVRGRAGKFELANRGTVFLDEVADLSAAAQAKLLRVVQELAVERVGSHCTRSLDVRLIVATNQRLTSMVETRRFRSDLFYRLSGVEIHVPSLRERRSDVPLLAAHFLRQHGDASGHCLAPCAMDALTGYDWPGNVRELRRVIEHVLAFSDATRIQVQDLPATITGDYVRNLQPSLVRDDSMRAWGSRYARIVLDRCGNNKRQACRVLGISYHTLQSYLRYGGHTTGRSASRSVVSNPEMSLKGLPVSRGDGGRNRRTETGS